MSTPDNNTIKANLVPPFDGQPQAVELYVHGDKLKAFESLMQKVLGAGLKLDGPEQEALSQTVNALARPADY